MENGESLVARAEERAKKITPLLSRLLDHGHPVDWIERRGQYVQTFYATIYRREDLDKELDTMLLAIERAAICGRNVSDKAKIYARLAPRCISGLLTLLGPLQTREVPPSGVSADLQAELSEYDLRIESASYPETAPWGWIGKSTLRVQCLGRDMAIALKSTHARVVPLRGRSLTWHNGGSDPDYIVGEYTLLLEEWAGLILRKAREE